MKMENRINDKFDEIDNYFKKTYQILSTKESVQEMNIMKTKISLLESIERVDLLSNEILPYIKQNSIRIDKIDVNNNNVFREIKRIEEMIDNKPDR